MFVVVEVLVSHTYLETSFKTPWGHTSTKKEEQREHFPKLKRVRHARGRPAFFRG